MIVSITSSDSQSKGEYCVDVGAVPSGLIVDDSLGMF